VKITWNSHYENFNENFSHFCKNKMRKKVGKKFWLEKSEKISHNEKFSHSFLTGWFTVGSSPLLSSLRCHLLSLHRNPSAAAAH
jgi:hypothetical protein